MLSSVRSHENIASDWRQSGTSFQPDPDFQPSLPSVLQKQRQQQSLKPCRRTGTWYYVGGPEVAARVLADKTLSCSGVQDIWPCQRAYVCCLWPDQEPTTATYSRPRPASVRISRIHTKTSLGGFSYLVNVTVLGKVWAMR